MKIMVADDDRDMVDMLSYWLKGHGYDVIRAFDGEQAIKRWRETLPDLVILDVQMPKLDGFEVCRQMRSETNSMVLILTAHDREDDEILVLEMGADDYLRKPFSPERRTGCQRPTIYHDSARCRIYFYSARHHRPVSSWVWRGRYMYRPPYAHGKPFLLNRFSSFLTIPQRALHNFRSSSIL